MNHRCIAPSLFVVFVLILVCAPPAAGYYVQFEYYAYAGDSDGIPLMGEEYMVGETFTSGDYTKTGAYGNQGHAHFLGSLAEATVRAEAYATGVPYEPNNFAVGTGRVETIGVMDDVTYTVPAGEYPAGVYVTISGHALGVITSQVGAGAEAGIWVSHGAEVYQTGVLVVGVDEAGTINVDDDFTLIQELVAPGTTLNNTVAYSRQVRLLIHRGWTWSVAYNTGAGYVTGDGSIDFATGDRGVRVTSVDVPPGVTWDSDSGVFFTRVSDVPRTAALPGPVLHQNHPNPFNPATTIAFELTESGPVDLRIYDVAGRLVRSLLRNENMPVGPGRVVWRGDDDAGASVATGVYLYRLETGSGLRVRRMTLLR